MKAELEVKTTESTPVILREDQSVKRVARSRNEFWRSMVGPLLMMTGSLSLWEGVCRLLNVKEFILPAPSVILTVLIEQRSSLITDTIVTGAEALGGFILANILSMFLAISFCFLPWLEKTLYPYLIGLKSVPVIAIAPLLVLWIGYGPESKVVMAAIIAFFPLVVNSVLGLKAVERDQMELFHAHSATQFQILYKLRFPTAIPYIFAALKVSSTLAVLGAIVAELTGSKIGVGFTIMMASYNINTPLLFAAIFCASLLGVSLFLLMVGIEKIVGRKYKLEA